MRHLQEDVLPHRLEGGDELVGAGAELGPGTRIKHLPKLKRRVFRSLEYVFQVLLLPERGGGGGEVPGREEAPLLPDLLGEAPGGVEGGGVVGEPARGQGR